MSTVWDAVEALATCLCSEILNPDNGVPDVCFCGVVPGDAAVVQYAGDCSEKCGMAWVRLGSVYPASSVGVLDQSPGNCTASIGYDVELGIVRCMSVGDEQGNLPPPEELLAAAELQAKDALVLWRAVYCCDVVEPKTVIVGNYVPLGPDGGLVGGIITVQAVL
jgi:hypothetical protein